MIARPHSASPGRRSASSPICWLILGWCLLLNAAVAQDQPPAEIVGVRVGFNGSFVVGKWTPVAVTVRWGRAALPRHQRAAVSAYAGPDHDGYAVRQVWPDRERAAGGVPRCRQRKG